MPRRLRAYQSLSIVFAVVIMQSCTCFGVPIQEYFPNFGSSSQPEPATATPTPLPSPTPAASGLDCAGLRLTSPLDGLPNGTATFYWDALAGAERYQINLYSDSGAFLAGFEAAGDQTSLSADVSANAIGGQFVVQVEFVAVGGQGDECRQSFTLFREAPAPQAPEAPVEQPPSQPPPPPTPTCDENPSADYC